MAMTNVVFQAAVAFLVTAVGTGLVRQFALRHELVDRPGERRSHVVATPRSGGLAMAVTILAFTLVGWLLGHVTAGLAWAIFGAGGVTALVGFIDDLGHVRARYRLLAHGLAAGIILYFSGGFPPIVLFGMTVKLGWFGYLFGVLYLVWLLNLYNFMDGIDGIAALEAMTVLIPMAVVISAVGLADFWSQLPYVFAAAVAGFLVWNFPRAKIFMGDVGSGFLGLILGLLSLMSAQQVPSLLWAWLILLGVFITDATITLLRRLWQGQRVYEAHRSHAYQKATIRLGEHWPVSVTVAAINLVWLFPWAYMAATGRVAGVVALFVAYAPLIGAVLIEKGGVSPSDSRAD